MIQRPRASRGRSTLVPTRRSPVLTLLAALATITTLALGVATVSTVPRGAGSQAGAPESTRPDAPRPPGPSPGEDPVWQGNPGAGGSGSAARSSAGGAGTSGDTPEKVFELAEHPLLNHGGLVPAGCDLPEWRDDLASVREFFTAAQDCLDAAWGPVLRRHNLPFHPPDLHFPTGSSFRTACGTIEIGVTTAAYYCEDDLYVPFAGLQTEQYGQSPGIYLALFAHEYGHHVQELTGIMDAAWQRIYRAGRSSDAGLEMARRKELQAQCFSGMFLATHVDRGGAITQQMFSRAWRDQASRGDDNAGTNNHGTNAHYAKWWRTGAHTNSLAACNTFSAPASAVS